MSTAAQSTVTITVAPDASAARVAPALRAAGLVVTEVFDEIGVINGHCPAARVPALRRVPGVADVAPTLGFDIGPPDAGLS